jgi:hypothetical protein
MVTQPGSALAKAAKAAAAVHKAVKDEAARLADNQPAPPSTPAPPGPAS